MYKIENSKEFNEIINDFNDKNFQQALKKTKLISKKFPKENILIRLFASIYFNLRDWENAIKYYEKTLVFENKKFKIYTNIGVALFNLGKISQSINAFKNSINDNSNFGLAHNNLGVSYLELGLLEEATKHFVLALNLNEEDLVAQKNLINILNLIKTKNQDEHPLMQINDKISKIESTFKITNPFKEENIKIIIEKSNELINNLKGNLSINETQIFRKNSNNLNCNRHFKVFNQFNIIPKYCFNCYKVQINLKTVVDLIKLFFIFDRFNLDNNNIRKCIVEIRDRIKGNYKGYIYCTGLIEAKKIMQNIKKIMHESDLNNFKIVIKHGCSEFYKTYPSFEKINFNGDQEMKYNKDWIDKEKLIDMKEPTRLEADKKILGTYLRGVNLSDILIISNWINYANTIGDYSYKKIYDKKIKTNFMNKILEKQLKFRKENLTI